MKLMKTLVLGLGIFLACGCGKRPVVAAYIPYTTQGNYTPGNYMNKPGAAYGGNQGMYNNQGMNGMNGMNQNIPGNYNIPVR